jgi:hypothetical protein
VDWSSPISSLVWRGGEPEGPSEVGMASDPEGFDDGVAGTSRDGLGEAIAVVFSSSEGTGSTLGGGAGLRAGRGMDERPKLSCAGGKRPPAELCRPSLPTHEATAPAAELSRAR